MYVQHILNVIFCNIIFIMIHVHLIGSISIIDLT